LRPPPGGSARQAEAGGLPLLSLPGETDDLPAITEAAETLRRDATDVVFLGTGGSSLGGQTLAQLKDYAVRGPAASRRSRASISSTTSTP
jgi:glucose-6-phosphate isomerase